MNKTLEELNKLISKLDEVVAEYNDEPLAGSQFEKECSNYPHKKDWIIDPFTFGRINLRAGREHLAVLPLLFQSNDIFSGSVVARAVLEASSLALWFLSPSIDENERVNRGLIQLSDGKNQVKQLVKDTTSVDDFFDNRLPKILTTLGIEYRDGKGRIVKPHKVKPSISNMIELELGLRFRNDYRILSGMAHGQPVILMSFGYDVGRIVEKNGAKEVEFKPSQSIAMFALFSVVEAYKKASESYFEISGWDFAKVKPSFDAFFLSLADAYASSRA